MRWRRGGNLRRLGIDEPTTIGGVARAWRRAAASQGKGRHARGRELRRAREPHRRLDEGKSMEDEGVGHRDTLVAMMAPARVATVAEREAAAAEEDGGEDEEARVASASDSGRRPMTSAMIRQP